MVFLFWAFSAFLDRFASPAPRKIYRGRPFRAAKTMNQIVLRTKLWAMDDGALLGELPIYGLLYEQLEHYDDNIRED